MACVSRKMVAGSGLYLFGGQCAIYRYISIFYGKQHSMTVWATVHISHQLSCRHCSLLQDPKFAGLSTSVMFGPMAVWPELWPKLVCNKRSLWNKTILVAMTNDSIVCLERPVLYHYQKWTLSIVHHVQCSKSGPSWIVCMNWKDVVKLIKGGSYKYSLHQAKLSPLLLDSNYPLSSDGSVKSLFSFNRMTGCWHPVHHLFS